MAALLAMSLTAMANGSSSRNSPSRRLALEGAADHWNHREDEDYFTQPGMLFRLMNTEQQAGSSSATPPARWAMRRGRSRSATSATA